ncbi:proline-rich protein 2-like [Pogoniulus pusillus]|uniref:proline-rich protein 2-like n=1 Tax=Pogoniulus pusillus TaxID=488313 RepID=UPI0030B998A0
MAAVDTGVTAARGSGATPVPPAPHLPVVPGLLAGARTPRRNGGSRSGRSRRPAPRRERCQAGSQHQHNSWYPPLALSAVSTPCGHPAAARQRLGSPQTAPASGPAESRPCFIRSWPRSGRGRAREELLGRGVPDREGPGEAASEGQVNAETNCGQAGTAPPAQPHRHSPTGTAPPAHSHRHSPTGTLPPAQPHRHSPTGALPPAQPHRHSPTGALPPAHSHRHSPTGTLPPAQPHRHSPTGTAPPAQAALPPRQEPLCSTTERHSLAPPSGPGVVAMSE